MQIKAIQKRQYNQQDLRDDSTIVPIGLCFPVHSKVGAFGRFDND